LTRITDTFSNLKQKQEGALIAFIMGGDPSPKHTSIIADAIIESGADILEIGVPFSDPIADGPVIQESSDRALNSGTTINNVLDIVKQIRKKHDIPLLLLSYYNPIFKFQVNNFISKANNAGVDGVIIPDLPIEESLEYLDAAKKYNIDTVFLATPATSVKRLKQISLLTSGFLYLVSLYGVTGSKHNFDVSVKNIISQTRTSIDSSVNLAVGFGVSTPDDVFSIIRAGANGAIVGSALVDIIANNDNFEKMIEQLKDYVKNLKAATYRS
jgi:tryptophan synthase alpha chain